MDGNQGDNNAGTDAVNEGTQNGSRLSRRHIGEAVALVFYFALDAYEIWPQSHLIALAGAVFGISALAFAEFTTTGWLLTTFIVAIISAAIFVSSPPILEPEGETHGLLLPASDPNPKTSCTGEAGRPTTWTFVDIAGGGVFTNASGRITALQIGNHPTVTIERTPQGLMVDVDMFTSSDDLAVRITQNKWIVVPSKRSYLDRPDRSTLVVHDKLGNEMFKLRYANEQTVIIKGVFHISGDETPIVIGDSTITLTPNTKLYMAPANTPIPFVPCFVLATPTFNGPILTIK